jgi:hypothetical protein
VEYFPNVMKPTNHNPRNSTTSTAQQEREDTTAEAIRIKLLRTGEKRNTLQ